MYQMRKVYLIWILTFTHMGIYFHQGFYLGKNKTEWKQEFKIKAKNKVQCDV